MSGTTVCGLLATAFTLFFLSSPAGRCGPNFIVLIPAFAFGVVAFAYGMETQVEREKTILRTHGRKMEDWRPPGIIPWD